MVFTWTYSTHTFPLSQFVDVAFGWDDLDHISMTCGIYMVRVGFTSYCVIIETDEPRYAPNVTSTCELEIAAALFQKLIVTNSIQARKFHEALRPVITANANLLVNGQMVCLIHV